MRYIIVSNRLPVTVSRRKGQFATKKSVGGLATGVSAVFENNEGIWIGWPGIASDTLSIDDREELEMLLRRDGFEPVFLSSKDISGYYHGYSNKTLWPLFHYFANYTVFSDNEMWRRYVNVNKKFAKKIIALYRDGDIVWVHDYHLFLVPQMVRREIPDATIGFFLHIPFPSYEVFRLLPERKELLEGVLGADLIGFHTYDYVRHFLSSVRRIVGIEHHMGRLWVGKRQIKASAFPMGIDTDRFIRLAQSYSVQKKIEEYRKKLHGRKLVLSIDRLDYSKGIDLRLKAIERFFDKYPKMREKVVFALIVVPSRSQVETYQDMKERIDKLVGQINGKYGGWGVIPVWYMYKSFPQEDLIPLYALADVALITPIRDGMNLVAKEYIAVKQGESGMLVLSEMAGAATELGEAVLVNPMDTDGVADAIYGALTMSIDEKKERMSKMFERVKKWNVHRWAEDFVERLESIKDYHRQFAGKILTGKAQKRLKDAFVSAQRRVLLLDYDGTLTKIVRRPEYAKPDKEIKDILRRLARKSDVVIVSGRDRKTLDQWFGDLPVSFVAEHGAWIKHKGKNWNTLIAIPSDWKDDIRPIMELYADRTAGAFVEEKEHAIAWHYRLALPEHAQVMAAELKEVLMSLISGKDLEIIDGNKVIEVRVAGINKGIASSRFIEDADFILAAGDDWTDEDMFEAMPEHAWTIKVGPKPSKAKWIIEDVDEMRRLLSELSALDMTK